MKTEPGPSARPGFGLRARILAVVIIPLVLLAALLLLFRVLDEIAFAWRVAAILSLLGVAAAGAWFVFTISVARPFERLARAARQMTGGAMLVQVGPNYGPGELGQVERAFDAMVETAVHQKIEIEEARRTLDEAINSLGDGLALYDADERLVFCNEQMRALYGPIGHLMIPGVRLEDLARAQIQQTGAALSSEQQVERLAQFLARFRTREKNTLARYLDGRWMRSSRYATSTGGTVVTAADVSDLVRREHELVALNRRVKAYAEASADWFWDQDAAFRFTFMTPSPGLYDPKDMIGKTRWEMDSAPDLNVSVWPGHRARLYRREPFRDFRFRLRATDGRIRTVSVSGLPVYAADGAFDGYCGVGRDITEEVEAIESLRLSEERFRALAETAPTGIYRMDAAGTIVFANEVWRKITALPPVPLGAVAWRLAVHPEDQDRVVQAWGEALNLRQDLRQEYRVRRTDGSVRWVVDTAAPERDRDGGLLGFVGTLADVTEKREIEARLEQSRRLEALGHLTGGIAHDFNNLLMIVLGNAEMLEDLATRGGDIKPERLQRLARTILNAAERGTSLTQKLLSFSRRRSVRPEKASVHKRIQELGELIRRNLGGGITLVLDLSAEQDEVMIDVAQLENAVINLALNARDAMPTGGRLTISTRTLAIAAASRPEAGDLPAGRYLTVAISDTGTGMSPDVASRAIEPFFTTKPEGQASGLGLSIAYGVVKQARGEIRIDSEEGKGTIVTLTLPLVEAPATAADREPAAVGQPAVTAPPVVAGRPRVLVVDDDAPVLSVMKAQLERLGCETVSASSADSALRLLAADQRFDLLFSDIDLGSGPDGFALAREARTLRPSVRIMLTTGKLVERGESDESPPILPKPFTLHELAVRLRKVLA